MNLKSDNSRNLVVAIGAFMLLAAARNVLQVLQARGTYQMSPHGLLFLSNIVSNLALPLVLAAVDVAVAWQILRLLRSWASKELPPAPLFSPALISVAGWLFIAIGVTQLCQDITMWIVAPITAAGVLSGKSAHDITMRELIAQTMLLAVQQAMSIAIGIVLVGASHRRRAQTASSFSEDVHSDSTRHIVLAVFVLALLSGIAVISRPINAIHRFSMPLPAATMAAGLDNLILVLATLVVPVATVAVYFVIAWFLVRSVAEWAPGEFPISPLLTPSVTKSIGGLAIAAGIFALCFQVFVLKYTVWMASINKLSSQKPTFASMIATDAADLCCQAVIIVIGALIFAAGRNRARHDLRPAIVQ
jgi:heme/copper-type cytochrome/quinol oxidase subunit 2